jgi:hypothetical protein
MIKSVATTLGTMPARAWAYGQRCPHEAIVYGLALAAIAMVSKLLLALLSCVVVASGVTAAMSR